LGLDRIEKRKLTSDEYVWSGMLQKLMKVMDDMCVKEDAKFEKSSMHEMQSISWSQKIF
jgi:hypothetical protein